MARPRSRQWRSLRVRLLAAVLLSLLAIATVLAISWLSLREREQVESLDNLTQTAQSVAVIADLTFDEGITLARAIASDPAVETLDPARFVPRLRTLHAIYPQYTNILVVDAHGTVRGWAADTPFPVPAPSVAERGFFGRVTGSGQPTPIRVAASQNTGAVGMGVAVPIVAADGSLAGLVAITFAPEHVANRLATVGLFPSQILSLLDPTGRVATFAGRVNLTINTLSWDQRDLSSLPEVQKAMAGEVATSSTFRSPSLGDTRLVVFVPTPRHGWIVGATWPVAEADAPAWEIQRRELEMFALLGLIVVVGASLASRTVVTPLRRLAEHARSMGDGHFEPVSDVRSGGEIGELTVAFNTMGERLQRTLGDLRHEQARLEAVIEHMPIGVVIRAAPDNALVMANAQAGEIWGQAPVVMADASWYMTRRAFHVDGRPYDREQWPHVRAVRDGEVIHGEEMIIERSDETTAVIVVSSAPLRDEHGEIVASVTAFDDVTERRQTQIRLREHEELLRALVDQFPGSVGVVDRDRRLLMVAGERYADLGMTAKEMVGKRMDDLYSDEVMSEYVRHAERAFEGEVTSFDLHGEGQRVFRLTVTPLRDEQRAIEYVLNVAIDVTEERARLERTGREEKLRALGQMAAGIAHDLNQALALVAGYGDLSREALDADSPDRAALREMLQIMGQAAYDGGGTVKQLLSFARGQVDERRQLIDVGALLREVEQLTTPRWRDSVRAEGTTIVLRVEAAPGLTIVGSPAALREVLTNLVFNALDALKDGGTITLAAHQEGGAILIDVADTGVGMTSEVQQRIFEPFFTTKGAQGTGLGLAMVFGIVQGHGGQIDIDSAPAGRGTTVHLRFPVARDGADGTLAGEASAPVRPLRILVVDDEPKLSMLAAGMLQRGGHQVVTAGSGEEALGRVLAEVFDLVLTDLSMGDGMNGWDLAAAVGRSRPGLPVLLATGWGGGIEEADARARGVRAVISKPYRMADVQAVIARVAAEQTSQRPMVMGSDG